MFPTRVWKVATRLGPLFLSWSAPAPARDHEGVARQERAVRHLLFEIEARTPQVLSALEELWCSVNGSESLAHRRQLYNAFAETRWRAALARFVETEVHAGRLHVELAPLPSLHELPETETPLPPLPPAPRSPREHEKTFIAVHLVDQRGEPVPGRRFEITLPDGSTRQGFTDAEGWGRVSDFTQDGEAKITFLAFDELDYLSGTSPTKKLIPISAKATSVAEAAT